MDNDKLLEIYNETLFSDLSDRIPSNIKSYVIKLVRYENSEYYKNRINKTGIENYRCDLQYERNQFYKVMLDDVTKTYKSLFPQYTILFNNYEKIKNYLQNKIK